MAKAPTTHDMLDNLISSPSISSNHPHLDSSNLPVINLLAEWLDEFGFDIKIQPLPEQNNKANLIARLGNGDDGLALSGHTDTVPCDENLWDFDPFKVTQVDSRYYGLGTSDMKSFFALIITALKDINLNKLNKPITILATADEESSMAGAKALLSGQGKLGRYCIIGEPTTLKPVHQHKGIFMESIRLLGRSGHSSDPRLGNNALEGMHEIIQTMLSYRDALGKQFVNQDFAVPQPTLNLGHIHGGDNPNRICGQCELHYDLRTLPDMEINNIRNNLHDMVLEISQRRGLKCEFTSLFEGTPALSTPATSSIVKLTEQLTNTKSNSVVFATEGPYFSQMGMETIILGPGSIDVAHQPNEYIENEQLDSAIDLYKKIINKVCIN
ncbi:MAG: acetylornithine deacetylase [Gammaproteobacteria bacterium]|nr:acetylornithine deacetylase [Gammaproteobacteria bacterium]